MIPAHINPMQWHQAQGFARQTCARFFRDGLTPPEAAAAFGLAAGEHRDLDWERAVDLIAAAMCAEPMRRAA